MNDFSSTLGLVARQVRDVQSVTANVQYLVRQLVDGRQRGATDRPGGLVARAATCAVFAHLRGVDASDIAREHFATDRDLDRLLVLRAAVNPANTTVATWAAELVQTATQDVADRLIPQSVLMRLRALGLEYSLGKAVIKAPTWSPTATGGFIAEGAPVPVCQLVLGSISLTGKKAANIIAVDDEMFFGVPGDVETTLRAILSESIGLMIDGILLGNTAATAASPAGLLNGVTPITASVLTPPASAMAADIRALIAAIAPALRPVLITGPLQSASISLLAPTAGLNVLTMPTLTAGTVIAVDAAAFASALGVPSFRASQSATLHMDTAATALSAVGSPNTVAAPMRSAFQTDVTALRSIIPVDWGLRRSGAVAVVTGATW